MARQWFADISLFKSDKKDFTTTLACQLDTRAIDLIAKWQPINYSFVCMLISPLCLVNMYKTQKNFEVKMRQRGLINMQTKE